MTVVFVMSCAHGTFWNLMVKGRLLLKRRVQRLRHRYIGILTRIVRLCGARSGSPQLNRKLHKKTTKVHEAYINLYHICIYDHTHSTS